jgi:hypothetical protein
VAIAAGADQRIDIGDKVLARPGRHGCFPRARADGREERISMGIKE